MCGSGFTFQVTNELEMMFWQNRIKTPCGRPPTRSVKAITFISAVRI